VQVIKRLYCPMQREFDAILKIIINRNLLETSFEDTKAMSKKRITKEYIKKKMSMHSVFFRNNRIFHFLF